MTKIFFFTSLAGMAVGSNISSNFGPKLKSVVFPDDGFWCGTSRMGYHESCHCERSEADERTRFMRFKLIHSRNKSLKT